MTSVRDWGTVVRGMVLAAGVAAAMVPVSTNAEQIRLISGELPGVIYNDGGAPSGPYHDLVVRLEQETGVTFAHEVTTFARSRGLFERGRADCRMPAGDSDFLVSKPFNRIKYVIVTPPGSAPITDLSAVENKTLGIVSGVAYFEDGRLEGFRVEEAPGETINMRKLLAGRLDAALAILPDFNIAASDVPGSDQLVMDADNPVFVADDAFICQQTDVGRMAIDAINRGLDALGEEGLKQVLGLAYVE